MGEKILACAKETVEYLTRVTDWRGNKFCFALKIKIVKVTAEMVYRLGNRYDTYLNIWIILL